MRAKTESLRQSESKRGKELESREVQGMCVWYLKTEMMSRWWFDRRTHLAVTSEKNQHKGRMRDIHVGKRGSEAAGEEQSDKLRKTVRFEQEASSAAASSDPTVALEYPASGETQDRPCTSQVMLMTTYKFLRSMRSTGRMDEGVVASEKCWYPLSIEVVASERKHEHTHCHKDHDSSPNGFISDELERPESRNRGTGK